jgi:glycosyltransferase involved in cell wall biosynthesis
MYTEIWVIYSVTLKNAVFRARLSRKPWSLVQMTRLDPISVVVTTYNRSEALIAVLRGLAAQDDRDFELVIADDGSSSHHVQAIERAVIELGLHAHHVWHPDVGFTAARVRNLGVLLTHGSYIVFLDGDCVPETDFISRHRKLREEACFVNGSRVLLNADLTKAVMQGQEKIYGRGFSYWLARWREKSANKWTSRIRLPDLGIRKKPQFSWRGIRSCNLGVWRRDYEAVDGFDETFVGWGHEDADLVLRLHNLGVARKNGFFATEVYHLWHTEASRNDESLNAQRVRQRMRTSQIKADRGLAQCRLDASVTVKRWG